MIFAAVYVLLDAAEYFEQSKMPHVNHNGNDPLLAVSLVCNGLKWYLPWHNYLLLCTWYLRQRAAFQLHINLPMHSQLLKFEAHYQSINICRFRFLKLY